MRLMRFFSFIVLLTLCIPSLSFSAQDFEKTGENFIPVKTVSETPVFQESAEAENPLNAVLGFFGFKKGPLTPTKSNEDKNKSVEKGDYAQLKKDVSNKVCYEDKNFKSIVRFNKNGEPIQAEKIYSDGTVQTFTSLVKIRETYKDASLELFDVSRQSSREFLEPCLSNGSHCVWDNLIGKFKDGDERFTVSGRIQTVQKTNGTLIAYKYGKDYVTEVEINPKGEAVSAKKNYTSGKTAYFWNLEISRHRAKPCPRDVDYCKWALPILKFQKDNDSYFVAGDPWKMVYPDKTEVHFKYTKNSIAVIRLDKKLNVVSKKIYPYERSVTVTT